MFNQLNKEAVRLPIILATVAFAFTFVWVLG